MPVTSAERTEFGIVRRRIYLARVAKPRRDREPRNKFILQLLTRIARQISVPDAVFHIVSQYMCSFFHTCTQPLQIGGSCWDNRNGHSAEKHIAVYEARGCTCMCEAEDLFVVVVLERTQE